MACLHSHSRVGAVNENPAINAGFFARLARVALLEQRIDCTDDAAREESDYDRDDRIENLVPGRAYLFRVSGGCQKLERGKYYENACNGKKNSEKHAGDFVRERYEMVGAVDSRSCGDERERHGARESEKAESG
jgi:hypothetical protein